MLFAPLTVADRPTKSQAIMLPFAPSARRSWLAVGLLLAGLMGCSDNESTPASATPTAPVPTMRGSKVVETGAKPSPTATMAMDADADVDTPEAPLSVNVDADPESGGAPLTVSFTAEVEGGPGGLRYRWDFGDSTPPVRQLRAEHTYQQPGEYTATFSVAGPDVDETREVSIDVSEEGFEFDLDTDTDIGTAPLTVEFTASLDEDLPGPFYFKWDFGDGGRDVSNPTRHTYRQAGEYTATVTVTNAQGQQATRDVQITVDAPEDAAPEAQ
jgi:PKD repeat protein